MRAIMAFYKYIAAALVAIVAVGLFWIWRIVDVDPPDNLSEVDTADTQEATRTVAKAWQWDAFSKEERTAAQAAERGPTPKPFTAAGVHHALRRVELDGFGNVVLNHRALAALRGEFDSMPSPLSTQQLAELLTVIRAGLPGSAGEQVAQLVHNYHGYQTAQRQLDEMYPPSADATSARAHLEQSAALRQQHFGQGTAAQLFGAEEAYARYTIESMRIEALTGVSPEQKHAMLQALMEQVPAGVMPDKPSGEQLEWRRRVERYRAERQRILDAGLTEIDRQRQIEALLAAHFRAHEIEAARRSADQPGG